MMQMPLGTRVYLACRPVDMRKGFDGLTEVACWAHARRKIYEAYTATSSPATHGLLERIGALFAIEDGIRGRPPDERMAVRRAHAVPLLVELKAACEAARARVSGKSSLGEALRYALSRWEALTRYTADGRLDICNNAAERAIRPLALGRKNWLFASRQGARGHLNRFQ